MKLEIDADWLLEMAEKEGNGIISVGGLVERMRQTDRFLTTKLPMVGDTWIDPENSRGELYKVAKVDKATNEVKYEDGGYDQLDFFASEDCRYVLVGREPTKMNVKRNLNEYRRSTDASR